MKPFQANIFNCLILIVIGLWGYWTTTAGTALIAPSVALVMLATTPWFKKDNKVVAHIVVLLTFLLIIALIMPLMSAISDKEILKLMRVGIMIFSCITAMVVYIRSFIDARKNKV